MTYLILFVFQTGLPNPGILERSYPDRATCQVQLEKAIETWTVANSGKVGFGIVGRCSDKPLNKT